MTQNFRQRINSLESKKRELIGRVNGVQAKLRHKKRDAEAVKKALSNANVPHFGKVKRQLQILEFKIATEALSLDSERRMMKQIKVVQAQFDEALDVEKKKRKLTLVLGDIEELTNEEARVEEEIQSVKKELDAVWNDMRAKRAEAAKTERKVVRKKDVGKLMEKLGISSKPLDDTVSLGDIAVIKKKGK